jgi:hypothetical protein
MRPVSIIALTAALGSTGLLAACAGGSPAPTSVLPSSSSPLGTARYGRGGGASRLSTCITVRRHRARMARGGSPRPATLPQPYVYIADDCGPIIDVDQRGNYDELGFITTGVSSPYDAFVDSKGNLYVANVSGPSITEYAPGNWSAPNFTYNVNMTYPDAVTADVHGNVYEGDELGVINEYHQNDNVSIASCSLPSSSVYSVAVDGHNDVFAAVFDGFTETLEIVEYPGGLNNCDSLTVLPVPSAGSGIALDKNANLLIAAGGEVEVVDAPSYNTLNATIGSGFSGANNVRLNKNNTLAFVTDVSNETVTVVNYPSGTNRIVLGSGNGLSDPVAAVEAPNAVY